MPTSSSYLLWKMKMYSLCACAAWLRRLARPGQVDTL